MSIVSFAIIRKINSTVLTAEDNKLFMSKAVVPNVFLTTNDGIFGVIHDREKPFAFVEIYKENNSYTFKSIENELFFCSKPLNTNTKSSFNADRVLASDWEEFDLEEIQFENSGFFIKALKDYQNEDEVKLHWWRGKSFLNFGDELNLHIISYLTNKRIKRVEKNNVDLIGIGSILDWFPKRVTPYEVWGSGTLSPKELLSDESYNISLLRGPLTKSLLKNEISVPYGDPGILTSLLWDKSSQQKYDWGLIVHHAQVKSPWVKKLIENTPNSTLISVKTGDMSKLMSQISCCKNIASTSLHGLIVADSYCIPNIWLWENNLHRGGQWKFFDYFAGVNRLFIDNINPAKLKSLSDIKLKESDFKYLNKIESVQDRVVRSFPLK